MALNIESYILSKNHANTLIESIGVFNNMELLWENPNNEIAFIPQTITIENLNKYKLLLFRSRCYYDKNKLELYSESIQTQIIINNNYEQELSVFGHTSSNRGFRYLTINNNKISFNDGYWTNPNGYILNNVVAIPVEIYGLGV